MAAITIEFEGKIRLKENFGAKGLIALLEYLIQKQGFSIKKFESDEIKLIKNDFTREHEGEIEITKSNITVEIEIEVSDSEFEVEIKSESLDLVHELTTDIAAKL